MTRTRAVAILPPERRCPAKTKVDWKGVGGGQCRHVAGHGTPHKGFGLCFNHGGLSPPGEKQAERLMAQAAAQSFGLQIETTPESALEAELWRTVGIVSWLGSHLQSVEPEQRLSGPMAVYATLHQEERRHLLAVSKACIDTGLDARRVSALEKAADAFADCLRRILSDLGVADDPRAPEVVRRHLALLGPGGGDVS